MVEFGDWLVLLGVAGGLSSVVVGLIQYSKAQRWKRAEFVYQVIKEFESKRAVRNVMQILDYNRSRIGFEVDKPPVKVTDDVVEKALRPHREGGEYNDIEKLIRDAFDEFLDGLERFETFVRSGLVSAEEFGPYLDYWVRIIGDPANDRKFPDLRDALWTFIKEYRFTGVQSFFARFGYDVLPPHSAQGPN